MTDSGPNTDPGRSGMSFDFKPHAYDPALNPELFEGVLARRIVAFLIDVIIITVPLIAAAAFIFVFGLITFGLGWLSFWLLEPVAIVTQHSRDTPQFYLTAPSPCPYLAGKEERKVFTHLVGERAPELNNILTQGGFRRSQSIAYRPACEGCRACVSVRVIAKDFRPTRSMRRVANVNADIE